MLIKKLITFIILITLTHSAFADSDAEKLETAEKMFQAWNTLDWDGVSELFSEDGILHSMMKEPIVGREVIRQHIYQLVEGVTRLELEVRNIGVINDLVFVERVDDFDYRGKRTHLPVVGVLLIEKGKVKEWREYYDRASLLAGLE